MARRVFASLQWSERSFFVFVYFATIRFDQIVSSCKSDEVGASASTDKKSELARCPRSVGALFFSSLDPI